MERGDLVAGRFRVERAVGRGGMGTVYRANDESSAQPVALKLLHDDTPQATDRFSREIAALARLSHPRIVRYIAHGEAPSFVAMEWLEGEDLSHRLKSVGRLSVREAVDIGIALADALDHVHALGIVHRDIKPGNLFFEGGDLARLRVVDFGLAVIRGDDSFRTAAGLVLGTPGYMAPEQARGQDVDARADVFATACVVYRCITGRGPFAGGDPVATLAKLLIDEPAPASSLRPETPPALDALLARAMSKDREGRPASARELRDELRAIDTTAVAVHDESPSTMIAPASSATLSVREQRILSVVVAAPRALGEEGATIRCEVDAAFLENQPVLHAIAARHGARLEASPAAIVAVLEGRGSATDRAAAAARLAIELRSALGDLAVALVTGRAEVTRRSVGEAIDRAVEHVSKQRDADAVWIDETTAGLLGPQFIVRSGSGGMELLGEKPADVRVRTLLGKPTPCVGRDRELAFLDATLAECRADDVARGVLVTAPAGAGKSRVRYEWLRKLEASDDAPNVWTARADAMTAGAPLSLLAQLVRGAIGLDPAESIDAARARIRARVSRHVRGDEDVQRIAEFLGEIASVRFPAEARVQLEAARRDAQLMADQMRRAWEDFVGAEADAGCLVIVLEDLHWADQPTIQFIHYVLAAHAERPLMVLALARPEVKGVFPALEQTRHFIELPLGDLTTKASARLARHVLGDAASAETIERAVARAAGNAFFLEEILRAIAEGRGEDVPETVLAMVQRRLDALEPEARRVLRAASAFGETFWRGGVLGVASADSNTVSRVDEWLDELGRRELVTARAGSRFAGERELAFRHAIVREAAYATLTEEDRTLAHRLAGKWLEDHGETDSAVVAGHFDRGDDRERAVIHYARAAAQAIDASDLVKAIEHAERAVSLGARGEMLGELRRLEAEAMRWRARVADCEAYAREAASLLSPRTPSWYAAVAELGTSAGVLSHVDGLIEARAMLLEHGDPSHDDYAMTLARIATQLYVVGQIELADDAKRRIEAFDAHASGPVVHARIEQVRAYAAGDYGAHFEHMMKIRALFEMAGDRRNTCVQSANLGYTAITLGALDEAEKLLVPALRVAEGLGIVRILAIVRQNIGLLRHYQGRNAEALALQRESFAAFDAQGDRRLSAASMIYLSMALAATDDARSAMEAAARAVQIAEPSPPMHAVALANLAGLEARDPSRALEHATVAYATLERLGGLEDSESLVRAVYAEALAAAGYTDEARRVARDAVVATDERAARIGDEPLRESFRKAAPNARIYAIADRLGVIH